MPPADDSRLVLRDFGFAIGREGDTYAGHGPVTPEMLVPGSDWLRTSVLATWADSLGAGAATAAVYPIAPTTLDLTLDVCRPLVRLGRIRAVARPVKVGRQVIFTRIDFWADDAAELLAVASVTFMANPDGRTLADPEAPHHEAYANGSGRLAAPLAEACACVRLSPGVATLPKSPETTNGLGTVNGGLLALVAEEAALSLAPAAGLSSLAVRYLRAARVGPVIATAERVGDVVMIDLCDHGADDRLVATVTARR